MLNYDDDAELKSLLPYGENIRPLLMASGLSEYDLKFLLQKRGIFIQSHQRNDSVPELSGLLLSPKEFEILRNRQTQKESNIKRSTAQIDCIDEGRSLVDALDAFDTDIEEVIKNLVGENSPYSINELNRINDGRNKVIFQGEIKRNDWTKDVFSSTSFHQWKVTIEKTKNNLIEFATETTAPETKDLTNKILNSIHNVFQKLEFSSYNKPIQKILSTYFTGNHYLFEYLFSFTQNIYPSLKFQRIIDMETGLDEKQKNFPENFKWLKGNIGEIKLTAMKGKKLEQTDIIEAGKIGILVFGEIDAEFSFSYSDINGRCIIQFGFPKFYSKRKSIEFETKISNIELGNDCTHTSKESVKRYLLTEFQREKHNLFEAFIVASKADVNLKTNNNQYVMNM